jgi:hypothetical protein
MPHTAGVLVTRLDLTAVQRVLQQAAMDSDISRSGNNISLSLIDDSWDHSAARRDAWRADNLDYDRQRAAMARAFRERPGVRADLVPCPPLGSLPS